MVNTVILTKGNVIVEPVYDGAAEFCEESNVSIGIAKEAKWGYIDYNGKQVIPLKYSRPSEFNNNLALVRVGDFKTGVEGYINKQGKFIWKSQINNFFDHYFIHLIYY